MNKSEAGKLGALSTKKLHEKLKQKSIIEYYRNPVICKHCGKNHSFEKRKNKFCSINCATTFNNLKKGKKLVLCLNCEKHLVGKARKFCSTTCQQEYQYKKYIEGWKSGSITGGSGQFGEQLSKRIKDYIKNKYKNSCTCCGINSWNNKPISLQVEHIDGNSTNHKENNLTLLCPNCHSQTPTYGAKNKGKGRHYRRIRYQEGKSS